MSRSLGPSTRSIVYCKPEQPPPITARRNAPFGLPFSSSSDASLHAAVSVTLLRLFPGQVLGRSGRKRLVTGFPKPKWANILVAIAPRLFAQILASITIGVVKEQSVKILAGHERSTGHGTGVGAMLDRPFVWE